MTLGDQRIHLPEALDGPWDHAVICTYNANLAFYEQALARKLGTARNRVLLIDREMLDEAFEEAAVSDTLRHVNAGYVAGPVTVRGAAHAKFILLTSGNRGRLLVGSGNLTMSGYSGKGEQFTRYDLDDEVGDAHLGAFVAVKELLDAMVERSWVDDVTAEHLGAVWPDSPWIYSTSPAGASPVRHNVHDSIVDQFSRELGGRGVDRLTVHAPYWDHSCAAFEELLERTRPGHVRVLVQPGVHQVDGGVLESLLARHVASWEVRPVQAPEPTFLHAKFFLAEQDERAVCLQGSANLSVSALLRTAESGNIELVNLLTGPRTAFDHLVDMLQVSEPVEPSVLVLPDTSPEDQARDRARLRIVQSRWDGTCLTIHLDRTVATHVAVFVGADRLQDVGLDQDVVTVEATAEFAERLDRGAPVRVEAEVDGQQLMTTPAYPYRSRALRSLLRQRTDPEQLRRIAKLELGVGDDIEHLLHQLEDALVIDRRAVWKMAGQTTASEADDEGAANVELADLDWDRLAKHPKLAQYGGLASATPTDEPTSLQILLSALTSRLGELGSAPIATPSATGVEDDDVMDTEFEELDEDERAERQEAAERARDHAVAQQRRAFGSFVKRFVRGLTDPAFGELVGPGVVTPNFVLLIALLGRLLARDRIAPQAGVDECLRAIEYFWGDDGYLETLSDADRELVDDVLTEHHAHAVTLAAIYRLDSVCQQNDHHDRRLRVRDLWRSLLASPSFPLEPGVVAHAAAEATAPVGASDHVLVDQLEALASLHAESEIWDAVGSHFGVDHLDLAEHSVVVGRAGRSEHQREVHLGPRAHPLEEERVNRALATWRRLEPTRGYYRIVHAGTRGRALLDTVTGDAWWMADRGDEPHDLLEVMGSEADWERGLRRLRLAAASQTEAATAG